MSKFTYHEFNGDEGSVIVFNKSKYTKEEALQIGKKELASILPEWADCEVVLFESFIRFGYGWDSNSGFANTYWIKDLSGPAKQRHKNELAVWCVRPSDEALSF